MQSNKNNKETTVENIMKRIAYISTIVSNFLSFSKCLLLFILTTHCFKHSGATTNIVEGENIERVQAMCTFECYSGIIVFCSIACGLL